MSEEDASELLSRLRETGDELPLELRTAIVEAESKGVDRDELVAGLVDILQDRSLRATDARDGSPRSHAALLLGLLEADEALEPLLDTLQQTDPSKYLSASIGNALQSLREEAIPLVVERYRATDADDARRNLVCGCDAIVATEDARILEIAVDELERCDTRSEATDVIRVVESVAGSLHLETDEYAERVAAWFEEAERELAPLSDYYQDHYERTMKSLKLDPEEYHEWLKERTRQVRERRDEPDDPEDDGIGRELRYNADEAPDPEEWLAADEHERTWAVRNYHAMLDDHPEAENEEMHHTLHMVVENFIAGDEYGARETCERLVEAGVDRHTAIHEMALQALDVLMSMMQGDPDVDDEEMRRLFEEMDPDDIETHFGREETDDRERRRRDPESRLRERRRRRRRQDDDS